MNQEAEEVLTDRYGCPLSPDQLVTDKKTIYLVIEDADLGMCIKDIKTKTVEMLTPAIAIHLEIIDERLYL